MSKKLYEEASVQAIADAIRDKCNTTDTMTIAEMPDKITNMSGGFGAEVPYEAYIPRSWLTDTSSVAKVYAYLVASSGKGSSMSYQMAVVISSGKYYTVKASDGNNEVEGATSSSGSSTYTKYLNFSSMSGRTLITYTSTGSTNYMPSTWASGSKGCYVYCGLNVAFSSSISSSEDDDYYITVYNGNMDTDGSRIYKSRYVVLNYSSVKACPYSNLTNLIKRIWFVPDSLLSSYKSATNWAMIADNIYPISQFTMIRDD